MCEVVRELNVSGCALSTLYPATLTLYRRAGYECAGHRCEIRISAKRMRTAQVQWPIRAVTEADLPALEAVYRRRAMHTPVMIDRGPFAWKRVRSPRGETAAGYMVINPFTNLPEAYTWFLKKDCQEAPYNLHLTDAVFCSHEAGLRLVSFLAHHRTMCDAIIYYGGINDPLLSLLEERASKVTLGDHWMLRIVDVGAALSSRGYPAALSAELHLDIEDDVVVSNNGRYVLRIRDGQPTVETGGEGTFRIDIRGLASLYTGHRSPRELMLLGQLQLNVPAEQADDHLGRLEAAFAGPAPTMTDAF
jgi:predicted acetyltransferase